MEWNGNTMRITIARRLLSAKLEREVEGGDAIAVKFHLNNSLRVLPNRGGCERRAQAKILPLRTRIDPIGRRRRDGFASHAALPCGCRAGNLRGGTDMFL